MITTIYGTKLGMTQLFTEDDKLIPITVINCRSASTTVKYDNDFSGNTG